MAYDDRRDKSSPFIPLTDETEPAYAQGWDAAIDYHRLKRFLPNGRALQQVRDQAVAAVLERARTCVRHTSHPTVLKLSSWTDAPAGDFDLEESLEAGLGTDPTNRDRYMVRHRAPNRLDLVLILDMSLSMSGDKIALMAVAAAVLALRLPMEDLAVVSFDSDAHRLKCLGEQLSVARFVRRVMEVSARGYTNLEGGLKEGLEMMREGHQSRRLAVLMSDGDYNVGWDPIPLAGQFPRLHVIHVGDLTPTSPHRHVCQALAAGGRGRYYRAESYDDLPRIAYRFVQDLFR